jgi:alanine dehydrogenase
MLVGIPKEIKDNEYRVGLVPSTVRELTAKGHSVLVERNAGIGAGIADGDYEAAGAELAADAEAIFSRAEMIVKVRSRWQRNAKSCGAGKSYLPICIWPRTARRPRT